MCHPLLPRMWTDLCFLLASCRLIATWPCRGSYYQRAWQALAARAMGLQHVVQPNAFALQLPHEQAHSPGEAALPNFEAVSTQ